MRLRASSSSSLRSFKPLSSKSAAAASQRVDLAVLVFWVWGLGFGIWAIKLFIIILLFYGHLYMFQKTVWTIYIHIHLYMILWYLHYTQELEAPELLGMSCLAPASGPRLRASTDLLQRKILQIQVLNFFTLNPSHYNVEELGRSPRNSCCAWHGWGFGNCGLCSWRPRSSLKRPFCKIDIIIILPALLQNRYYHYTPAYIQFLNMIYPNPFTYNLLSSLYTCPNYKSVCVPVRKHAAAPGVAGLWILAGIGLSLGIECHAIVRCFR